MWFRVDDEFWSHPKIQELPNSALGLWVKSGSWCAAHLTDGVIPDTKVRALGSTVTQVRALITAGLWVETVTSQGRKAYCFVDWEDYQLPASQVLDKRRKGREKKRRQRSSEGFTSVNENLLGFKKSSKKVRIEPQPEQKPNFFQTSDSSPTSMYPVLSPGDRGGDTSRARATHTLKSTKGGSTTLRSPARETETPNPFQDSGSSRPASPPPAGALRNHGTADDPRCETHATLPRGEVPACRACAAIREHIHAEKQQVKARKRAEIDACDWCDRNGMVTLPSGLVARCDHTTHPNSRPEAPQSEFQPQSDPEYRRALLEALKRRTARLADNPQPDQTTKPPANTTTGKGKQSAPF